MFMGEEAMDLWEPAPAAHTAVMWAVAEDSGMTWASGHEGIFDWNSLDETSAVFGGHIEEEDVEGNIVVESCTRTVEDEVEHPQPAVRFEELEEQVDFFERSPFAASNHDTDFSVSPSDSPQHEGAGASLDEANYLECTSFEFVSETRPASPEWLTEEEEQEIVRGITQEKAPLPALKIIGHLQPVPDSVVSTPDVVNDLIDLENDGLFRNNSSTQKNDPKEEPQEIVYDLVNEDEYVVEYIDESEITRPPSPPTTLNLPNSSVSSENEQEAEEDSDEEYKPPAPKSHRSRSLGSVNGEGKKRGRPAKPLRKAINPRELVNLPPEAKLYKMRRFKNNEASRRSRFNRRQNDLKLSEQCEMFEDENSELRRVLKAHNRLHNKLRALIVNIKIST